MNMKQEMIEIIKTSKDLAIAIPHNMILKVLEVSTIEDAVLKMKEKIKLGDDFRFGVTVKGRYKYFISDDSLYLSSSVDKFNFNYTLNKEKIEFENINREAQYLFFSIGYLSMAEVLELNYQLSKKTGVY